MEAPKFPAIDPSRCTDRELLVGLHFKVDMVYDTMRGHEVAIHTMQEVNRANGKVVGYLTGALAVVTGIVTTVLVFIVKNVVAIAALVNGGAK